MSPHSISRTLFAPVTAPVTAPEFPPPVFRQPPSPNSIRAALSNPPFIWNGISLRIFREPASLSDFARLEEQGKFLNPEHRRWYKILKSALETDLEDLKTRHEIETEMEPSLRAVMEMQETRKFHEEFMEKLGWGKNHSPLLLRPANLLHNELARSREEMVDEQVLPAEEFHKAIMKFVKQGLKTEIPSIKRYFESYPGPTISWVVQDFYKRQELAREAAKLGLEFQQMWEWSERHWNFFEAASRLREWVMKGITKTQCRPTALMQEYNTKILNWSPVVESRKRRHQWAVLNLVMKAYEARDEKFPKIQAPAGRSFGRYFGKYGEKEGWYPVDRELEGINSAGGTGGAIIQLIHGTEKALEAGESLVQACAGIIDGCSEEAIRRPLPHTRTASPPRTIEEADALLVQMRLDADAFTSRLRSAVRTNTAVAEPTLDIVEELPDPTDDSNGDAKVNTQTFLSFLRKKLIGDVSFKNKSAEIKLITIDRPPHIQNLTNQYRIGSPAGGTLGQVLIPLSALV